MIGTYYEVFFSIPGQCIISHAFFFDRDKYLLVLLKYIHTNPVRAKISETLETYRWSSHSAYTGKNNPRGLIDTDQVLRMVS